MIHDHTIGQVCGHDEVMLHHECSLLAVHDEALDHLRAVDALLRIKVSARLVNEVHIGGLAQGQCNRKALQLSTRQSLNAVVDDVIDDERLHDVRNELRVDVGITNSLVKQLPDSSLEFRRNLLRLVADVQIRSSGLGSFVHHSFVFKLDLLVALQQTSKHSHKSSFSGSVFSQQHDDFGVGEGALIDVQDESCFSTTLRLGHFWVAVTFHDIVLRRVCLSSLGNLEGERVFTKSQIFRWNETGKEGVDSRSHAEWHCDNTVSSRTSVQHAYVVAEIIKDGEIVLNNQHVASVTCVYLENLTDHMGRSQPLLHIQVGRRLVKHVHIADLHGNSCDGKALQFATGQISDLALHQMLQFSLCQRPIEAIPIFGLRALVLLPQHFSNLTAHGTWDVIDVLGLDGGFHRVLQDSGEVALKLAAAEVDQDLFPIGRGVVSAEVGLELSSQDLQSR
mmetsp:Transcript_26675/g.74705  ORF Transcript_26675/g.74705 Transcript_26675/m.74705 type:complete len:450 (-) Transcript_26675:564-1913(-)